MQREGEFGEGRGVLGVSLEPKKPGLRERVGLERDSMMRAVQGTKGTCARSTLVEASFFSSNADRRASRPCPVRNMSQTPKGRPTSHLTTHVSPMSRRTLA